jgi:hypothetical protein
MGEGRANSRLELPALSGKAADSGENATCARARLALRESVEVGVSPASDAGAPVSRSMARVAGQTKAISRATGTTHKISLMRAQCIRGTAFGSAMLRT